METLAFGYGLAEAPRVDDEGRLYFTDVVGGGVYRIEHDGSVSTVLAKRRGCGGLVLHQRGGIVVSGRNVVHVLDGTTRVLLEVEGALGFNDLTTDAQGRVYVGSLRSSAFESGPRVPGELWRIDGDGRATKVYDGIEFANGVGFAPDGRTIYHSNYSEGYVLAHDVDDAGNAHRRRIFARMPGGNPDGLAVDESGAVWVALGSAGGIARFAPDGNVIAIIDVPAGFVTSLCFGGSDRRDLYVTTADNSEQPERAGTVFRSRSPVAGLVAPRASV
jgi:sugar lactone lactonase YvrE